MDDLLDAESQSVNEVGIESCFCRTKFITLGLVMHDHQSHLNDGT